MVRPLFYTLLICAFSSAALSAQEVLFYEDFNNCAFPAGWEAHFTGNQNPVWYVGICTNTDALGESIDGSCALIIDDDATGNNTPAFAADFITPAFDASQYSTILLEADIHYRDYGPANEFFEVWVTDGATEQLLARYDENLTNGDTMADFFKLRYDLSFLTNSPQARLIFRYDDQNGFAWWAAVDNIKITGSGAGTNVIKETFNGCEKPAGWETEIVTGNFDWNFGKITQGKALNGGNSMDGSCFVFFDDDFLLDTAAYSDVRLYSPWFSGIDYANFEVAFDVIMRYYAERVAVYVQHGNGEEFLVRESNADVGGPYFPDYVHSVLDISAYRSQQMRVVFEYDDGKSWGWWAGFDNIKVTGSGEANDICAHAIPLTTGAGCKAANNLTALFDGPPAACTNRAAAGLWYQWQADFAGIARLTTNATFNDVVNVFTGDCTHPQTVYCTNRDEHGFKGEIAYFPVTNGTMYLIRISGQEGGFGTTRGDMCIAIDQAPSSPPTPSNDDCATAQLLAVGVPCLAGSNINGVTSPSLPSLNELARADVWYKFIAPALAANERLSITSNSDFSEIITAWQGSCSNLTEIAGNHLGDHLDLENLVAGQTYYAQISGNFASVEGTLCPQILKKTVTNTANDDCFSALNLNLGGQCTASNNEFAGFSGVLPPCVAALERDIWFQFIAPVSGSVRLNTGAAFNHVAAVWKGSCNNLESVWCAKNPLLCDGFITLGALNPGQMYYLQIGVQPGTAAQNFGDLCVKVLDGNSPPDFQPLTLNVLEICNGQGAALLDINLSGGTQPINYQGITNGSFVMAGESYLVVITDALGCEQSYAGTAKNCEGIQCEISAALVPSSPACHNAADGALNAIITGGAAPFEYSWSTGQTTASATGLPAGIYTVTVIDGNACADIISDTLFAPEIIAATPVAVVHPISGQANGAVLVDVSGGSSIYTYVWLQNGVLFSTLEDLVNAPAGNYTLQVTDNKGCTGSFAFILSDIVSSTSPETNFFAEISPNPAVDKATLFISLSSPQWLHVSVISADGRIVSTQAFDQVTEKNIPLPVKDLTAGVYTVRLFSENSVKSLQLVIGR
jgi:hypothetical protein